MESRASEGKVLAGKVLLRSEAGLRRAKPVRVFYPHDDYEQRRKKQSGRSGAPG